jgi:hypothetical protein
MLGKYLRDQRRWRASFKPALRSTRVNRRGYISDCRNGSKHYGCHCQERCENCDPEIGPLFDFCHFRTDI